MADIEAAWCEFRDADPSHNQPLAYAAFHAGVAAVLGDRDTLRETVARAIRDRVRLGPIGPNSAAIIAAGGRVSLTVSEADAVADAVLDVLYGAGEETDRG